MEMFQILDCNATIGTCCSDLGLVSILNTVRTILNLFQIFVPIILIVGATLSFIKLAMNPEIKNGTKNIINQFVAAVICFFIPVIVNFTLGLVPDTFELSSCWKQAAVLKEIVQSKASFYVEMEGDNLKGILVRPEDYEQGDSSSTSSGTTSATSTTGSAKGEAIVEYAKSFVGKPYLYGGEWNGELPYSATDCSGFVQGVFKHFGINLADDTKGQWQDTNSYELVGNSPIKPGDLAMYDGHVAILTGNGTEIIHAKGRNYGVAIDSDYRTSSGKTFKGIMRIKGVN